MHWSSGPMGVGCLVCSSLFPAEYCSVARWSMLFMSTISGLNVLATVQWNENGWLKIGISDLWFPSGIPTVLLIVKKMFPKLQLQLITAHRCAFNVCVLIVCYLYGFTYIKILFKWAYVFSNKLSIRLKLRKSLI